MYSEGMLCTEMRWFNSGFVTLRAKQSFATSNFGWWQRVLS